MIARKAGTNSQGDNAWENETSKASAFLFIK